jgi:hypothetical protein
MSSNKSQCAYILRYMQNGYPISPLEALKMFGCFRLGARIYDLKQSGKRIRSKWVKDHANGKRFKEYWMPAAR